MRHCVDCGKDIPGQGMRLYCHDPCLPHSIYVPREKVKGTCLRCGKPFAGIATKQFCSQLCLSRAKYKPHAKITRTCKKCGTTFDGPGHRYYCSRQCRSRKPRPRSTVDHPCSDCGKIIYQGLRCRTCSRAYHRQRSGRQVQERDGLYMTRQERVEIFERDNWTCQLCGALLQPDEPYPDPDYPTIDHIVPLSKGGTHTPDNWQAAHLYCNLTKRNSSPRVGVLPMA